MAKKGDGWLHREMGAKLGRWVAKCVAHLLATAALWVRIEASFKIQIGRVGKGVANTL